MKDRFFLLWVTFLAETSKDLEIILITIVLSFTNSLSRTSLYFSLKTSFAFFLHHNYISSCRILVLYKWTASLNFFHGRSIFWKTLFSLPSLLYFLSFVLILSSGDCNVYISEQLLYQVKGFVLCRMSTTLALWFAEILTMYTIMLVIRFRTWVLFKVMLPLE